MFMNCTALTTLRICRVKSSREGTRESSSQDLMHDLTRKIANVIRGFLTNFPKFSLFLNAENNSLKSSGSNEQKTNEDSLVANIMSVSCINDAKIS